MSDTDARQGPWPKVVENLFQTNGYAGLAAAMKARLRGSPAWKFLPKLGRPARKRYSLNKDATAMSDQLAGNDESKHYILVFDD